MKKILVSILAFSISLISCSNKSTYKYPFKNKIPEIKDLSFSCENPSLLVNLDGDHWNNWLNNLSKKEDLSEEDLKEYVSWYRNTNITDLMFNIFDQSSNTKTNVLSFRGDMYKNGVKGSASVDYSFYEWNYKIIEEKSIDVFDIWFEECKKNNINPWISIRMNDCHNSSDESYFARGDLFYEAKDKGWFIGENYGYFKTCLNYEVKEVRDYFLNYINEQLFHYDVHGIELDFLREIYCFDYLHKDPNYIVGIMNNFMSEVYNVVLDAETKWGHKINVSVRLPRDLEQAFAFGFDALFWDKNELVDSITISPRWESCDSAMPVNYWKNKLPNTKIYAGLESLILSPNNKNQATCEVVNGYAAQYLSAGADGIYLYNYNKGSKTNKRSDEVFNSFKNVEEAINSNRRHIVTYQDLVPDAYEPYKPLPIEVNKKKDKCLDIETGLIPNNKIITVKIGLKSKITEKFHIKLNNSSLEFVGETIIYGSSGGDLITENAYAPEDSFIYEFKSTTNVFKSNIQKLTFENKDRSKAFVQYIEIDVN